MASILIRDRQAVIDIAMQHHGSAEAVHELCLTNDISITQPLTTGRQMKAAAVKNAYVVKIYTADGIIPVSSTEPMPGGIGYWAIGLDYIVN